MARINNTEQLGAKDIEMILFSLPYYGIVDDIEINIIRSDKFLDRFGSPGLELKAMLVKNPYPHSYNLHIRPDTAGTLEIISHEMAHLGQYEREELSVDLHTRVFVWKGREYPTTIPYSERPWEIEAFREQKALKKAFKNR